MERSGSPGARIVLSPVEGEKVMMGGLGVRFMVEGMDFASIPLLVERHGLASP